MLSYDRYDGPSGRPLVILPGLFGVAENWQRLAKRFSELTTVYVLNLPFHGKSKTVSIDDAPKDLSRPIKNIFYSGMATAVAAWLQSNNLSDVVLVGHSMGGKVAMQCAHVYPELVQHLVVIDIAPVRYAPSHLRVFEGLRSADLSCETRTVLDTHLQGYISDPMQRGFFLKQAIPQPGGGFAWAFDVEALYGHYTALLDAPDVAPTDLPATLIAGEQSEYMTMASVAAFQTVFTQSVVHWLPTGHWVQVQDPDGVFAIVQDLFVGR
jgi:esterase